MPISEWNMRLKKGLEQASANYDPLTLKKVHHLIRHETVMDLKNIISASTVSQRTQNRKNRKTLHLLLVRPLCQILEPILAHESNVCPSSVLEHYTLICHVEQP